MKEEGRRKKEEGSSATDSLSADVTDVTDVRKKEEGRIISTFPFSYFPVFPSPFFPAQVRQSLWISIPGQSLEVNI